MKNFTRIFFAVAALFAFACTTDTTEDLGVQLGNGAGQTTLTLSLEESRTQLGEAVNGLYPVTWVYGDEISVNGERSTAMEITDNASVAKFYFDGVLNYPYAIAYPAAPAGKVVFAKEQPQAYGTFANGSAVMYGYAESNGAIELKHLTGVLKIGVKGQGAITRVEISTIDRKPIAGEFNLDFATGAITPTEASEYTVGCSFEESADGDAGLVLSDDIHYFHFAVPAGVYDELYVTIRNGSSSVMYATVKAGDTKPLVAGKVREFTNAITYTPSDMFIISDASSLREFASQAASLNKDAVVVADIDMTGESWTPIEGFAHHLIGNGFAIKGLTAPLFGTTNASIKGLHLVDVNINETVTPNVGAFARRVYATETVKPVIEHCSVSGKITIDCQNYTYKKENVYHEFAAGGFVGACLGGDILHCLNNAEIESKQCVVSSNTTEVRHNIGGIVGTLDQFTKADTSKVIANLTHCTSNGVINISNGSFNGTSDNVMLIAGGVIGVNFLANRTNTMEFLTNNGDMIINGTFSKAHCRLGGVAGWIYGDTFKDCVNNGDFVWESGKFAVLYYGGLVGYAATASRLWNVKNTANITIKEGVKQGASLVLGGITGYMQENSVAGGHTTNGVNEGNISIHADMSENTSTNYFRVGGVSGWAQCLQKDCVNNGEVKIAGKLYNAESSDNLMCVAGVVAYKTVDGVENVENNGKVTVTADVGYVAGTDCRLYVGGIYGYGSTGITNAKNTADITVTGDMYFLGLAGIAGYFGGQVTNVENTGDIVLKSSSLGSTLYVSGCLASSVAKPETGYISSKFVNRGSVSVDVDQCVKMYIGGCLGYWNQQCAVAIRGADNYGPITIKANSKGDECAIGGVMGYMYGTPNSRGLHNHKSATINVDINNTVGKVAIGGMAYGLRDGLNTAAETESVNGNDADIYFTGSTATTLDIAGIISNPNNYGRNVVINNGNIFITGAKVGTDLRVGGFECNHTYGGTMLNFVNNGDIFVDETTQVQGSAHIGGFSGGSALLAFAGPHTYNNCSNTGDITFNGEAGLSGTGDIRLGGALASFSYNDAAETPMDATITITDGIVNSGNITYGGKLLSTDGNVYIGGLIAYLKLNTKDLSTWTGDVVYNGNITCTGTYTGTAYVGGIFGETNRSVANGQVSSNIKAVGYNNVGMVLAGARTADIVASNFKVAGSINDVVLTADNFYNYIYGTPTDWTDVANYDGCSFLSVVPEI